MIGTTTLATNATSLANTTTTSVAGAAGGGFGGAGAPAATASADLTALLTQLATVVTSLQQALSGSAALGGGTAPQKYVQQDVAQGAVADGTATLMLAGKVLKHPNERIGQTAATKITPVATTAGGLPRRMLSEADVDWDGKGYFTRYPNVVQELREGRWVINSHGETLGIHIKSGQFTPLQS